MDIVKKIKNTFKKSDSIDNILKNGNQSQINLYNNDAPLFDPKTDKFNRLAFAQGIIKAIQGCHSSESMVIGIYGEWGDGKTTVLNFVENGLNANETLCIKFNPWRYENESLLLLSFFKTLAQNLGDNSHYKKSFGKLLTKYGDALASINITVGPVGVSPGDSITKLGAILSSNEIDDLKNNIDKLLIGQNKRIVIIIDDIDRLDKTEIQYLFKIVKLSADFKNTTYILAFDETMVAAALAEKYGIGNSDNIQNIESGRAFIEKIVQIPLHLPSIDKPILNDYCLNLIQRSINSVNAKLSPYEFDDYKKYFDDDLSINIKNARESKRYANSLLFSVPILMGNVNLVDLMLIEGIRIFYPKLYDSIRFNKDQFIDTKYLRYKHDKTNYFSPEQDTNFNSYIDNILKDYTVEEILAAKNLIGKLFPRLNFYTEYGPIYDNIWSQEKRIASKYYFDSYFIYGMPIKKDERYNISEFINILEKGNTSKIITEIISIAANYNLDNFLNDIRPHINKLSTKSSYDLAFALSNTAYLFPDPYDLHTFTTPYQSVAIIIAELIKNIPNEQSRMELAKAIIYRSDGIDFTYICLKDIICDVDNINSDQTFSTTYRKELTDEYVKKIIESCDRISHIPLYSLYPKYSRSILSFWSSVSRDNTNQYIQKSFKTDPYNGRDSRKAIDFLKCIPVVTIKDNKYLCVDDFGEHEYKLVEKIVDPSSVYDALYKLYGDNLTSLICDQTSIKSMDDNIDDKLAYQFYQIYKKYKVDNHNDK